MLIYVLIVLLHYKYPIHTNKRYAYYFIGIPIYKFMYFNYKRKEFPQRKHTYVCSQSRRNPGYVSLFHT